MTARPYEPPMPDPLAYFLTWPTYGTWLPGDERGWIEYRRGWQLPDSVRKLEALAKMVEDACRLDRDERALVERQVAETCATRRWELHAVNCRTNHLHVVVSADRSPKVVRAQLKAWCTRRLKEHQAVLHTPSRSVSEGGTILTRSVSEGHRVAHQTAISSNVTHTDVSIRQNWWAERGSQRFINDEDSLEAAILYVRDGQDCARPY